MNFIIAQIGVERLDWFGFGVSSANRTAAFIACVIVASWGFASVFKKSGFWISLLISLVFFRFLVQTQSRGALVALIFSMAAFFYLAKIGYNKSRLSALLVGCAALAFMYFDSALSTRMTNMATLQSSSANCRADIYLSGMKMLTDAPHGVVVEKSPAEIYIRWYQNPDDSERYLSMINSHLEFLCKHGLTARICYIAFWIFALCITFPTKKRYRNFRRICDVDLLRVVRVVQQCRKFPDIVDNPRCNACLWRDIQSQSSLFRKILQSRTAIKYTFDFRVIFAFLRTSPKPKNKISAQRRRSLRQLKKHKISVDCTVRKNRRGKIRRRTRAILRKARCWRIDYKFAAKRRIRMRAHLRCQKPRELVRDKRQKKSAFKSVRRRFVRKLAGRGHYNLLGRIFRLAQPKGMEIHSRKQ